MTGERRTWNRGFTIHTNHTNLNSNFVFFKWNYFNSEFTQSSRKITKWRVFIVSPNYVPIAVCERYQQLETVYVLENIQVQRSWIQTYSVVVYKKAKTLITGTGNLKLFPKKKKKKHDEFPMSANVPVTSETNST